MNEETQLNEYAIPSTSKGVKSNMRPTNRDERYFRPVYEWQCEDSFLDESQCTQNIKYNVNLSLDTKDDNENNRCIYEMLDHPLVSTNNESNSRESGYEQCVSCGKRFTERPIKIHKKQCKKVFSLDKCQNNLLDKVFSSNQQNITHKNNIKSDVANIYENSFSGSPTQYGDDGSKCDHCGKYFKNIRGSKIHVSKAHLDIHRKQIKNKYVSELKCDNSSLKIDNSLLNKNINIVLENKIEHQVNEWYTIFSTEMNSEEFSCKVIEFSQFLAEIIHELRRTKTPCQEVL